MGISRVGRKATAGLLGSDTTASYTAFNYIAIGTDNTAFASTQTGLIAQHTNADAVGTVDDSSPDAPYLQLVKTGFTFGGGAVTIYEFGVFDGATGSGTDNMLCRSVGSGVACGVSDTLDVTIKVTIQQGS